MWYNGVDWIYLTQDRDSFLLRAAIDCRVPEDVANLLTRFAANKFSIRTLLHGVSFHVFISIVLSSFTLNFFSVDCVVKYKDDFERLTFKLSLSF
jgi:hypothetical protein